MRCFMTPEVPVMPEGLEIPEEIASYQAPAAMSEDITSFEVTLDGAVYKIPAPVRAFLDNGWILQQADDEMVDDDDYTYGVLRKGNQVMDTVLYNITEEEQSVFNCVVSQVAVSDIDCAGLEMILPGGIKRGDTEEALVAALDGVPYEVDDESSMFTYYEIEADVLQDVTIAVDKETGLVYQLEVEFWP